jgi:oxygen-independent coproporphyrinogen-3 oxidase
MVDYSVCQLGKADYRPYYIYKQKHAVGALENTGWATRGTESLYNMIMMDDLGTVIGLGAGSSSKILGACSPIRVYSPKYPYEYLRDADKLDLKMSQIEEGLHKSWQEE